MCPNQLYKVNGTPVFFASTAKSMDTEKQNARAHGHSNGLSSTSIGIPGYDKDSRGFMEPELSDLVSSEKFIEISRKKLYEELGNTNEKFLQDSAQIQVPSILKPTRGLVHQTVSSNPFLERSVDLTIGILETIAVVAAPAANLLCWDLPLQKYLAHLWTSILVAS
jgi:hypothetical protein